MTAFESLKIGTRGLAASQLAMNVTGQNISNANTEGYSRKRVELSADKRTDPQLGERGFGVEIEKVARYTDEFLELQIRDQLSDEGYFTAFNRVFERIENILTEPNDSGMNKTLDKFWDSWQDLANNPQDAASREVVRSSALVMTDKFHTLANQMDKLRLSLDTDIEEKIDEINGLIKEIYTLNQEVATGELQNGEANDSRDKRDLLVRKLSTVIDVGIVEDELGRITLTTAGNVLVGPSSFLTLKIAKNSQSGNTTGSVIGNQITFANSNKRYNPRGGELKGIIDARDEILPRYQALLDQIAGNLVSTVNRVHESGYNLKSNTGISFFSGTETLASNIQLSASVLSDASNISAAKGGTTVGPITENLAVPPAGAPQINLRNIDPNYRYLTNGSLELRMGNVTLEEGAGRDYVVDHEFGVITFINYGRYAGGEALDVTFRYDAAGFPGPGDGSNALSIAQLRDQQTMSRTPLDPPNQTVGDFYAGLIGVLGIERNQAQANMDTRKFLVDQFKERKLEITGVSLDEELANMIRFEHTYQASARFISSINQILDVLLNI